MRGRLIRPANRVAAKLPRASPSMKAASTMLTASWLVPTTR